MTLPTTGSISFNDVNVELQRSPTNPISFNDPEVRGLAGIPVGAIGFNDLRGKSYKRINSPNSINSSSETSAQNPRTSGIVIGDDGICSIYQNGAIDTQLDFQYIIPLSALGDVEYRVTKTSGVTPSGITLNTIVDTNTTRSITISSNSDSFFTGQLDFFIDGELKKSTDLNFELTSLN